MYVWGPAALWRKEMKTAEKEMIQRGSYREEHLHQLG